MADPDRRTLGGYEAPLTLGDRSMGDRRPPRPRRPAPVTLVLSLVVLAVAVVAVVWLYRSGARGPHDAPQPVGAPLSDVRVAAPPQPTTPDPASGLSIYKDKGDAGAPPAFVPAPQEPGPRPGAQAPAPPASPPPPAPSAASPDQAGARPAGGDALDALINRTAKPAAKPQRVAQADAPPAPPAAAGVGDVQIGAFSSTRQADEAWSAAADAAPGAMAGKGKRVVAFTRDGTTLYRTFITGFASRDAAQSLCDRLKSAGRSCFVR